MPLSLTKFSNSTNCFNKEYHTKAAASFKTWRQKSFFTSLRIFLTGDHFLSFYFQIPLSGEQFNPPDKQNPVFYNPVYQDYCQAACCPPAVSSQKSLFLTGFPLRKRSETPIEPDAGFNSSCHCHIQYKRMKIQTLYYLSGQQGSDCPRPSAARTVQSGKNPKETGQIFHRLCQEISLPDQTHHVPDALPGLYPAHQSEQ